MPDFVSFGEDGPYSTVTETVDSVQQTRRQPVLSGFTIARSNPYDSANRTSYAGDSVEEHLRIPLGMPPRKSYALAINFDRTLLPHEKVVFSVSGPQTQVQEFRLVPTELTQSGQIQVTAGSTQTEAGGNRMRINARWELNYGIGRTESESLGQCEQFSVCAHPLNWKNSFAKDLNREQGVTLTHLTDLLGVVVYDDWESDSGTFADLDETQISEKVKYVSSTTPVFPVINLSLVHNSDYITGVKRRGGTGLPYDQHAFVYSELKLKTVKRSGTRYHTGSQIAHQLSIFRCERCGTEGVVVPNSGYIREHIIGEKTHSMTHKTTKTGRKVTIGRWTSEGGAGTVSSLDHIFSKRLL